MTEPLLIDLDGGVLTLTNNDAPINRMTLADELAAQPRLRSPRCWPASSDPRP